MHDWQRRQYKFIFFAGEGGGFIRRQINVDLLMKVVNAQRCENRDQRPTARMAFLGNSH